MKIGKALVTGPTGCIGTALVRELLKNGIKTTAVVRPGSLYAGNLPEDPGLSVVSCDLAELSRLADKAGRADAFFHLGWTGTYGEQRRDRELQEKNTGITLEAVRAASELGCSVFVYAGSQSEYGPVNGRIGADTPCHPDNPYGKAKLMAEQAAGEACLQKGIRFVSCRIFSVYGPFDKPYTMVMSTLRKMRDGERLSFTKGEQIWNYLYSADAGKALLLSAESGKDGAVYPVASAVSRPLSDYITEMRDLIAPEAGLYFGEVPYYPNQVMHMEPDISDLVRDTGFCEETSFEEGIRKTFQSL